MRYWLLLALVAALVWPSAADARQALVVPTGLMLASAAVADADAWWSAQGSPPPCDGHALVFLDSPAETGASFAGFAHFYACDVHFRPAFMDRTLTVLATGPRRAKLILLAQLWALAAHERGHNIGYGHIPGTVMQADSAVIPGAGYSWALSLLGPPGRR